MVISSDLVFQIVSYNHLQVPNVKGCHNTKLWRQIMTLIRTSVSYIQFPWSWYTQYEFYTIDSPTTPQIRRVNVLLGTAKQTLTCCCFPIPLVRRTGDHPRWYRQSPGPFWASCQSTVVGHARGKIQRASVFLKSLWMLLKIAFL